jgi:hypothetical protein
LTSIFFFPTFHFFSLFSSFYFPLVFFKI